MYCLTRRYQLCILSILAANALAGASENPNILHLEPTTLYNLPANFNGNSSQSFLQTNGLFNDTAEEAVSQMLKPFIAYDDEFASLLATDATLELIYNRSDNNPVADEMGIWVWDHNQVWMSSHSIDSVSYTYILDLNDHTVKMLDVSSNGIPILNPNGGGYFNGKVYIAGDGNTTIPPAIYEVDPVTHEAQVVVDSYFGLRFNGPNDLTWARRGDRSWLFFTDDPLSYYYSKGEYPTIPDATWRWDPQEKTLLPVIDRTDINVPNGIRVNKESTKLYVTDTPDPAFTGNGVKAVSSSTELFLGSASTAIYVFDLNEDGIPHNKRLFGIAQRGIPDGMHVDDDGRVWTGEQDGIVVRGPSGKVLGMINALAIQGEQVLDSDAEPLQNFALAGDKIIVFAFTKIYQVRLSRSINHHSHNPAPGRMPNMTSARDNLGPLITPFTYPSACAYAILDCSTCSDAWQGQTCSDNGNVGDSQDDPDCWPPRINGNLLTSPPFMGGGFYSPGISCPVGYTSACSATGGGHTGYSFQYNLLDAETAIGCCPSGYTCGYISAGVDASVQTCVSTVSTGQFSAIQCYGSTSVLTQQTVPTTVAASVTATASDASSDVIIQTMTIKAPLFQIIYKSSDLPKSTSTTIPTSTIMTAPTIKAPTSQPDTSLSTGAKAGIGVGAAVGGLILIGAAIFLLFLRRKRPRKQFHPADDQPYELVADGLKAELPGHVAPVEMDASKPRLPPAELG
ncbi:hypothetical protein BGW36DRAFT_460139 [Talaromyces proteolyticus]|uniref:SMP-30/Gluconolactonase/LRE-like region domain-containing protein n=1 Tax=Talaromyces proteolyticus TaxID=1131652 RepID=A0AAD4KUF2_9EURO|nr:uncharacterized protein BGW36DRAFT_460139 [Talaromyces proteolyticus]KAH8701082.1 hypothetical protein BGW36DRAFT_460139 [Talaromyces proteolyticus]